jgi:hypothetical protein
MYSISLANSSSGTLLYVSRDIHHRIRVRDHHKQRLKKFHTSMLGRLDRSSILRSSHLFERSIRGFGFGCRSIPFLSVDRLSNLQHRFDSVQFRADAHNRLGSQAILLSAESPDHRMLAATHYQIAASAGHPDSQFALGVLCGIGHGAPKDDQKSTSLLKTAAAAGHPPAAHLYGCALQSGRGIPLDPVKGTRMLRLAAEAGYNEGMYAYGMALCKGLGVPQNTKTAYDWFEKAAQNGHTKSMLWAGMLLGNGMGVQRNPERASLLIAQARKALQDTQPNGLE